MRNAILMAAVVLCSATPALAEVGGHADAFGHKGQWVPLGSLSFGYESRNDSDNLILQLQPGVLYFITESWAIGGTAEFGAVIGDGEDYAAIGFGPTVGFNHTLSRDISIFPQAQLYFRVGGGASDAVGMSLYAPVLWHIAQHFFVGMGPDLQADFSNDAGELFRFGAKSVIGGYF